MIQSISLWAGNIIVAVVIAGILEMMIIEGNNKKYIKAVFGLYIVFTIISPVIKNLWNADFKIDTDKILQGDKTYAVSSDSLDLDTDINKIYNSSLESDIKSRLIEKGYNTTFINIEIDDEKKTIEKIDLILQQNNLRVANVKPVESIGIQPINKTKKEPVNTIETEELKNYLSSIYDVDKQSINIKIET